MLVNANKHFLRHCMGKHRLTEQIKFMTNLLIGVHYLNMTIQFCFLFNVKIGQCTIGSDLPQYFTHNLESLQRRVQPHLCTSSNLTLGNENSQPRIINFQSYGRRHSTISLLPRARGQHCVCNTTRFLPYCHRNHCHNTNFVAIDRCNCHFFKIW